MNIRTIVICTLTALFMFVSSPVLAGNAGLLVSPTRVVIEGGKRFTTVIVRNNGDAAGRYKIGLIEASMNENGGVKILEEGKKDEFSARDLISLSPSSMTLNPDDFQNVRVLIKNRGNLPDGEYRSHLEVKMTDSDYVPPENKQSNEGTGITVKTKVTTVIPIIVRIGQTSYKVVLDDATFAMGGGDKKEAPEVMVGMSFSGNRSVLGSIKVVHIAPDGKETQVAFMHGVAIYRGVAKRTQVVSLTVPDGVNIRSGRLRVSYLSQPDEGSHVLSEKVITP